MACDERAILSVAAARVRVLRGLRRRALRDGARRVPGGGAERLPARRPLHRRPGRLPVRLREHRYPLRTLPLPLLCVPYVLLLNTSNARYLSIETVQANIPRTI